MAVNVAISGFGRIGRLVLRSIIESKRKDINVVAINDLAPIETNAFLLSNDTVHGPLKEKVTVKNGKMIIGKKLINVLSERDPKKLPWKKMKIDVALECTGFFTSKETASMHITAGAKKVLVSAPCSNADKTIVFGVNDDEISKKDTVISNASCTTNCLAPVAKVLHDDFGISEALMTTVHATTATQFTVDGPSKKDFRGGRSSLVNIMPASTGAAKAVTKVIPSLVGKITGMAFRVPTANVSVVDLTVKLDADTSYDEVMNSLKSASENSLKGILGFTKDLVVSQDFIGDPRTSIVDYNAGIELNSSFFKIVTWYDNEAGYSNKLIDLACHINSL